MQRGDDERETLTSSSCAIYRKSFVCLVAACLATAAFSFIVYVAEVDPEVSNPFRVIFIDVQLAGLFPLIIHCSVCGRRSWIPVVAKFIPDILCPWSEKGNRECRGKFLTANTGFGSLGYIAHLIQGSKQEDSESGACGRGEDSYFMLR
jgi:hypothetical protein